MDEADLREVNNIPPRMLVKAGSTLLVPRAKHRETDVSEKLAENGHLALASEGPALKRVAFKVGKKGDSVAGVARRHGVAPSQVAQWNKVSLNAKFDAGDTVVVYVKPGKPKAVRSAKAAKPQRSAKVAAASSETRRR
jgi:membrane-bound lytic murein transglycosylase D